MSMKCVATRLQVLIVLCTIFDDKNSFGTGGSSVSAFYNSTIRNTVFNCLLSGDDACLGDQLCPAVTGPARICDGVTLDCPGSGLDESRLLCEDNLWRELACPKTTAAEADGSRPAMIVTWQRCTGSRPGQCFRPDRKCDGIYDCVDRSDESGCGGGSLGAGRFSPGGLAEDALLRGEREWSPKPILLTLLYVLLGFPATWIVKDFLIHWFVFWFGSKKKPKDGEESEESQEKEEGILLRSEVTDEDLLKMLDFIHTMVTHVESPDFQARHEHRLHRLFKQLHNTAAWSENVRIIFDMGHLLFDARTESIDSFHRHMRDLETKYHQDAHQAALAASLSGDGVQTEPLPSQLDMHLCMKYNLGNRMTYNLVWSTEPPFLRKIEPWLPDFLLRMWRMQWCKVARIYFSLAMDAVRYYMDFAKDWCIFFILFYCIDRSTFFLFEAQMVFLLGFFLVVPELITGAYFGHNYKAVFNVQEYNFPFWAEASLKASLLLLSTSIPAVLLWERGRIEYENLQVQNHLFSRIESCMQSTKSTLLSGSVLQAFREDFAAYHRSWRKRDQLLQLVMDAKNLETSTETVFQYMLQLMVVLVVVMSTHVRVTPGLESVFFDTKIGLLICLALVLSFLSLISTRVKVEKWTKWGYFRLRTKLQFGCIVFVSLVARIMAIVFFFAPTIGLFRLGVHWHRQQMPFSSNFLLDGNSPAKIRDVFPETAREGGEMTEYTFANLSTTYLFFLLFLPWQCLALYLLKSRLVSRFRRARSRSHKVLHILTCLAFPDVFSDWDDKLDVAAAVDKIAAFTAYEAEWRSVRREHKFMAVWQCCVNLFLSLPTLHNCVHVILRHRHLDDVGFEATREEEEAYKVAIVMVFVPLAFVLAAFLHWKMLMYYYKNGHPWSRIFRFFPCEKEVYSIIRFKNRLCCWKLCN